HGERKISDNEQRQSRPAARDDYVRGALFQENWWLEACTGGAYDQVEAEIKGRVAARLPFVTVRRHNFTIIGMPASTHILPPWVDCGDGKPQTQLTKRLSLVRNLVEKLPRFDYFEMAVPSYNLVDGLAFQIEGFRVVPQYTFHLDCRRPVEELWQGMNSKLRQHIRRAEEKYLV